jgi:hypothetical protein
MTPIQSQGFSQELLRKLNLKLRCPYQQNKIGKTYPSHLLEHNLYDISHCICNNVDHWAHQLQDGPLYKLVFAESTINHTIHVAIKQQTAIISYKSAINSHEIPICLA